MNALKEHFEFITQILYSTLKLNVKLLDNPFENKDSVDDGVRQLFWNDFEYPGQEVQKIFDDFPENHLTYVKSALGFSILTYRVPNKYGNELFLAGPFLTEEPDNDFFSSIIRNNRLPLTFIQTIRAHYQTYPCLDEITVQNAVTTILTEYIPESRQAQRKRVIFKPDAPVPFVPKEDIARKFSEQVYSQFGALHNSLFDSIAAGDYDSASDYLEQYIQKTACMRETSIIDLKNSLCIFNGKCEYALLREKIHPFYISNTYIDILNLIKVENNRSKLLQLPYQIIKKYCTLVQSYSLADYSQTIRRAVNYINLHLDEPLSLSYLAEKLGKNSSFLSNLFKKETQMTITEYILQKRIENAILLLNTTSLSIQEIGCRVGIYDMSYFSKLFKKKTGVTPSEYLQMMR